MLRFPLVVVAILVFTVARAAEAPPRTPNPVIASAQQRIAAFHAGEKPSGSVVRLVYFHPADRDPLPDYAARLDRIMTDISGFFRDGLEQRFAVKSGGLPLERKAGKLVIHMVRGQHPAAHYEHTSGDETWAEVRKALAGTIDPEREHVLILYGLCRREPDGRFVFDAPYYGATWSDQRHGLCHAADCDVLDPLLLTANDKPMVFTEHYYPRIEMTLAKFNSWYLGGIAHELGHGLGLPHDNGGPGEAPGISLMGGGNLQLPRATLGRARTRLPLARYRASPRRPSAFHSVRQSPLADRRCHFRESHSLGGKRHAAHFGARPCAGPAVRHHRGSVSGDRAHGSRRDDLLRCGR